MLEKEFKYYNQVRDELRAKYPEGGFVVIKDETILGVWLNRTDALKTGIEAYGNIPFLVKDINENPSVKINFTRNIDFTNAVSYLRNSNLRIAGPIIEVTIVPPQPVAELLKKEGKPIPSIKAIALIDTGASSTCISRGIVDNLKLIPFDVQTVLTASGESQQLLYDIGVILPITQPNVISVQSPCADLSQQPFQVLIGRDILSRCTLFYNGSDNSFTLHH